MAKIGSPLLFSPILGALFIGFAGLALAQGTNGAAANYPLPWQTPQQIFVLPVSTNPLQAERFYAILSEKDAASLDGAEWLQIKDEKGKVCFAKWEEAGSPQKEGAVFQGHVSAGGLGLSKAVANYLGIDNSHAAIQWRAALDAGVAPGKWLRAEEQSVLLTAIRESDAPIGVSARPPGDLAAVRNRYLTMYRDLNAAELAHRKGDFPRAGDNYKRALADLQSIQTMAPSWERVLVENRIADAKTHLEAVLARQ